MEDEQFETIGTEYDVQFVPMEWCHEYDVSWIEGMLPTLSKDELITVAKILDDNKLKSFAPDLGVRVYSASNGNGDEPASIHIYKHEKTGGYVFCVYDDLVRDHVCLSKRCEDMSSSFGLGFLRLRGVKTADLDEGVVHYF